MSELQVAASKPQPGLQSKCCLFAAATYSVPIKAPTRFDTATHSISIALVLLRASLQPDKLRRWHKCRFAYLNRKKRNRRGGASVLLPF